MVLRFPRQHWRSHASHRLASSKARNVFLHDANEKSLGAKENVYDVVTVTTLDVLHDAPNPTELIRQVKRALKPGGMWLLADIPGRPSKQYSVRYDVSSDLESSIYSGFLSCIKCISTGTGDSYYAGVSATSLLHTVPF
jgi:ubiquinone/menaquinone biosynthesis C-methylase UbiE